jgi:hypothetical protein
VIGKGKTPQNWHSFLRDNTNKTELFNFLADKIVKMYSNNTVIVTQEEGFVCNHSISLEGLTHCNHEKTDTRIFLNSKHTAADGSKTIMIKSSDTYVLVIAVSVLPILQDLGVEELLVAFGQGQKSGFPHMI